MPSLNTNFQKVAFTYFRDTKYFAMKTLILFVILLNALFSFAESKPDAIKQSGIQIDIGFNQHKVSNLIPISSRKSLTQNIWLPIFSAISRPAPNRFYQIDKLSFGGIIREMHNRIKVGSFLKNFLVDSTIEYRYNKSKKFTPALCYTLRYNRMSVNEGFPFEQIQHLAGIKFYL
jgi:hypothetical protein